MHKLISCVESTCKIKWHSNSDVKMATVMLVVTLVVRSKNMATSYNKNMNETGGNDYNHCFHS